jgi:hypothetical protein
MGRDSLEDIGINESIILKWVRKECGVKMWTGFIRHVIGTNAVMYFWLHKTWEISWLPEPLLASKGRLDHWRSSVVLNHCGKWLFVQSVEAAGVWNKGRMVTSVDTFSAECHSQGVFVCNNICSAQVVHLSASSLRNAFVSCLCCPSLHTSYGDTESSRSERNKKKTLADPLDTFPFRTDYVIMPLPTYVSELILF